MGLDPGKFPLAILFLSLLVTSGAQHAGACDQCWLQLKAGPGRAGVGVWRWSNASRGVLSEFEITSLLKADLCIASNPLVFDVDGDGRQDVVVPSCDGHTYAVNGEGEILWVSNVGEGLVSPGAGDIDGDGELEIAVPAAGYLGIIDSRSGELELGIEGDFYSSSPLILDLDDDGLDEVVIGTVGGDLYIIGASGVEDILHMGDSPLGTPSGGDINGDGAQDVVVSSLHTDLARLYLVTYQGDSYTIIGSVELDGRVDGYSTVYDINGDGKDEVLVVTTTSVYALAYDRSGFNVLWMTPSPGASYTSPTVVDADGDGEIEIIVPTNGGLLVLNSQGSVEGEYMDVDASYGGVVAVDLEGDGAPELVVCQYTGEVDIVSLQMSDYYNGTLAIFLIGAPIMAPASTGDIDGDGAPEVVFGSRDFHLYMIDIIIATPQQPPAEKTEATTQQSPVNTQNTSTQARAPLQDHTFTQSQQPPKPRTYTPQAGAGGSWKFQVKPLLVLALLLMVITVLAYRKR